MYVQIRRWTRGLWIGFLLVGVGLTGCVAATPVPAILQEVGASVPTALPTATTTALPPTLVTTPTAEPTPSATPVPTAVPTSTPASPAFDPACVPLPVEEPGAALPEGDPGVYTAIGLSGSERLTVYSCPGTWNPTLRLLEPHSVGLRRAGQDQEAEGVPWTPVSTGDAVGWVQAGHLARQYGEADPEVAARAGQIVHALRDQDWETVARAVHPAKGVRFSPYSYVRVGTGEDADRVFSAEELAGLAAGETVYLWGTFDGSGEPIEKTFSEYYRRFVYDADFGWAYAVGLNEIVGRGNTIVNVAEVYPQAQVVEYHLPGTDPRFGGMDWRSLRLVLEKVGDAWYLVGVVHDEWTI